MAIRAPDGGNRYIYENGVGNDHTDNDCDTNTDIVHLVDHDYRSQFSTFTMPVTETTTTQSCGSMLPTGKFVLSFCGSKHQQQKLMHVNEGQNCPSNHNVGPYADPDDCSSLWNCEGGCAIKSQVLMAC